MQEHNEWVISLSPDAALAAGVVMIEQYATWNVLFYQRHPDGGYDIGTIQMYPYQYFVPNPAD